MSLSDLTAALSVLSALLVYPGLAYLLSAGLILALIEDRRPLLDGLRALLRPQTRSGRLALFSLLMTALAMTALAWPGYQLAPRYGIVWAWLIVETAQLLILMPALYDGAPRMVRAAARSAQYGLFGRLLYWALLTIAVVYPLSYEPLPLLGRLLLLTGMLAVYPVAVGRLSAVPEPSLTVDPYHYGAEDHAGDGALIRLAVAVRDAALLLAALAACLPLSELPDWLVVLILTAAMAGLAALLRWQDGQLPRATLSAGLRRALGWAALFACGALVLLR